MAAEGDLWALARELAESGDYASAFFIEREMRKRGFSDVREITNNKLERDLLTAACEKAQKSRLDPQSA